MKNFQIIILVVFMAAAVFGLLVFSGAIPLGSSGTNNGAQGTVVLWGTVSKTTMASLVDDFNRANPNFILKYEEKSPENFDSDLLEALASGKGPDMFFISDDLVYKYSNKIYPIPYQSFPLSSFNNAFVGAGNIFLTSKGVLAYPLTIDPLMMYYNQSVLDANNIAYPPTYWDELPNLATTLTKKDEKGIIQKSTVAMGEYSNVSHAKDLLATLIMQTGNGIIKEKNGSYVSTLGNDGNTSNLASVLNFYTGFANPLKPYYTWNKSISSSSDAFSAEKLAFYFGYASELESLINKNPNENFLVAPMPQIRNSNFKLTGARVMGVSVSSFSKNLNTAFVAAGLMAQSDFSSKLAAAMRVAPARRDLLNKTPTDAYGPTFYSSAFFARSWLDPSSKDSDTIFKDMIEKVVSNSMSPENSITDAGAKLGLLLIK